MKQTTEGQRKVVLHFNINRTIMLQDPQVSDQSKEECLQEILVGYAWGKVEQKDEKSPLLWKLIHPSFTAICPSDGMISYKQLGMEDLIHQLKKGLRLWAIRVQVQNRGRSNENVYRIQQHNDRRELYTQIVKQGSPCLKLKPEYDRILKAITVPKVIMEEMKMRQEELGEGANPESLSKRTFVNQLQERDTLQDLFTDGKFNLIPTFFKTMLSLKKLKRLNNQIKILNREFAIVLRPFGSDFRALIREFNRFCVGEHPCYSGRNNTPLVRFDGRSKGTKNYIVTEKTCGMFYGFELNTQLAMGALRRGNKNRSLEDEYEKEIEEEAVTIQKTFQHIYVQIMEQLKEVHIQLKQYQSCCLCLQDDGSKLLLLDQVDYDTLHIFFDDNLDSTYVVDAVTGEQIPKKKANNKYLVKVDIIEAIKDGDYFLKLIDSCDRLRAEEIDRIEKGISEEVAEVIKKSDYEMLIQSSDSEYLRKTILPLLQQAIKLVDIERPKDPLTFIAMYCLKNKDKVKVPLPTQDYLDSLNPKENVE